MVERNVSLVKFIVDCCNLDQFAGRPTRVRKMTDRGREFTVHLKRKAALKGKEEFRLQLLSFEKSIYDIGNPDVIRSELQKLKSLADNAIQGFIDWMNLTVEAEEINEITRQQYELQGSWEKVRATALSRLEFLEVKEEIKSNLSYRTRISSSSSVSKLLGLKAKRAALEQKIIFADTKEQEKTLAKLKLQQELSETLAEEAVYQLDLNAGDENDEDESLSQVAAKGFGSIIHNFFYKQKPSASVSYHVTNSSASVTQTSSSVKQSTLLEKQPQVFSFNTVPDTCHAVIKFCNTVINVCHAAIKSCNTIFVTCHAVF